MKPLVAILTSLLTLTSTFGATTNVETLTETAETSETPLWNYSKMSKIGDSKKDRTGDFEGVIFYFTRPTSPTATITLTAIVDGEEVKVTGQVRTTAPTEKDLRPGGLKMRIGNISEFRVTYIRVELGLYASEEANPRGEVDYELALINPILLP